MDELTFGKVLSVNVFEMGGPYEIHHYIECPFGEGFLKIEQVSPRSGYEISLKKISREDFPYLEEWNAKWLVVEK